jgi:hypothetical protein
MNNNVTPLLGHRKALEALEHERKRLMQAESRLHVYSKVVTVLLLTLQELRQQLQVEPNGFEFAISMDGLDTTEHQAVFDWIFPERRLVLRLEDPNVELDPFRDRARKIPASGRTVFPDTWQVETES